jgi:hypothetical protein
MIPTTPGVVGNQIQNAMNTPIRNGKSEIVGYHDKWSDTREILRDKTGKRLGVFESDTKVTRDATGKIIGRGENQLFQLLK